MIAGVEYLQEHLLTGSSYLATEGTEILYGEQKVIEQVLQFVSKSRTKINACVDRTRPLLAIEIESLKKCFIDAKKREVRLNYVTEITDENISYCKELMGFITELRHLDGIKGNFYISDTEYIAPAIFHEKGKPASQMIRSNVKEIVEHQQYVFDTLWSKAISAELKIREIEEGLAHYESRIIENQDEIIKEISRLTADSNKLYTCVSAGGMQYSYNYFFELNKKLVDKQKKGEHEGIRYISNINKDNVALARILLDAGIQIRHVKNMPPMSFGVSDKEAAATIEKMEGGKKVQSLLISNEPMYVTHFTTIFEELWKDGVDAADRIKNIEEGVESTNIEIIENPRESLKLASNMVKSAREEILRIYPSINAFRRQVKIGAMNLFKEITEHNVKVRVIIPSDERQIREIVDEVSFALPQLDIRCIDKSLETHIGIIVVDKKESLIVESKDDTKDNYHEAAGLSTYSNSKPIALSYASIFESLWKQGELYERSKAYNRMQKEFIDVAAHELRTPIQPIISLTEVLHSKIEDIQQKELLDIVIRNAKRLRRLVEDILDVTKIESNSLNLKKEQFNLNEVILNTIKDIKASKEYQYSAKIIKILYEPQQYDSIYVEADKGRISQVIFNLISNSIKFTKEGDIHITISVIERKQAGYNKNNNIRQHVVVSVKDTGEGIDPEIMPRLFQKFASKSFQGTGLGLYLSKNIVESHGGSIWAENNADGKGATFSFSLPVTNT
jgi:two-component system, OmpR family, sensor histidine kinase VicK